MHATAFSVALCALADGEHMLLVVSVDASATTKEHGSGPRCQRWSIAII